MKSEGKNGCHMKGFLPEILGRSRIRERDLNQKYGGGAWGGEVSAMTCRGVE